MSANAASLCVRFCLLFVCTRYCLLFMRAIVYTQWWGAGRAYLGRGSVEWGVGPMVPPVGDGTGQLMGV